VSSRPRFVLAIALLLILIMAAVGTIQNQKAVAQGLIDKIKKFVNSIIDKCTHTVRTGSGGAACTKNVNQDTRFFVLRCFSPRIRRCEVKSK
jgi:hypothetical protein